MADLPTRAELIIATCQAGQANGFYLTENEATAILDAILPLVMRGPVDALADIEQRIETWETAVRKVIGGREVKHGMDLSRARSVRQWAEKIGGPR